MEVHCQQQQETFAVDLAAVTESPVGDGTKVIDFAISVRNRLQKLMAKQKLMAFKKRSKKRKNPAVSNSHQPGEHYDSSTAISTALRVFQVFQ